MQSPLNRELERQGRTRKWMADRLGEGPWTFSRIEGGKQKPTAGRYERAAAFLGVHVLVIAPDGYTQPAESSTEKAAA